MTKPEAWQAFLAEHPLLNKDESTKVVVKIHTLRQILERGFEHGCAAGDEHGYAKGFRAARELDAMDRKAESFLRGINNSAKKG